MTNPNQTMRLVTSSMQGERTFRLIPSSIDCPYVEGIYDPQGKILVLLSKERKTTYHMLPKVDDNGDLLMTEARKPRPATQGQEPKKYREERKTMESFMEFYIMEKSEIEEIIQSLAVNHETYDYKKYTEASQIIAAPPETQKIELLKP